MTPSLISAITTVFAVMGIIGLGLVVVDTFNQFLSALLENDPN